MDEQERYEEAVRQYAGILEALKALYDERDRTLVEIWGYMQAAGAKTLVTPEFEVSIPTKRTYNPAMFQSIMGEVLPPDEFRKFYIAEHDVTKTVPAKVDGTAAKKLWDMGDAMVEKLQRTLIEQKPEVKLKARKKEQAL
jgi:hypothetical protein